MSGNRRVHKGLAAQSILNVKTAGNKDEQSIGMFFVERGSIYSQHHFVLDLLT